MTPEQFKSWRKRMGLTMAEAAEKLGVSKSSIELYERGTRKDDGRPVEIPRAVETATKWIELDADKYSVAVFEDDAARMSQDLPPPKRLYATSHWNALQDVLPGEDLVEMVRMSPVRATVWKVEGGQVVLKHYARRSDQYSS